MQFVVDKISPLCPGWNKRPLTEDDFYQLCKRFRIGVTEMPLTVGGFYHRVSGRDFIAVDSRLSGAERVLVLFHELGHFLLHTPDSGATASFHGVQRSSRKEIEADAFALCAVIPKTLLESRSTDELIAEGIDRDTLRERVEIYRRYRL
ncbi:MAG: ImmA/IrrE family metallo-endopeptidase [Pyrinomonadaceae bacterium]|nr:ImmA/IrrE family metallo-endopeptidase [Acidobacteriota bacterium]MBK7932440.1 ImmA/IrrE family metallo-endopeptidase [Acidobacteriota bacterium]MBP7376716.1 ImmA/IrrE family metallo-endopeptidase [Pyrinomonadaceae bacterium]